MKIRIERLKTVYDLFSRLISFISLCAIDSIDRTSHSNPHKISKSRSFKTLSTGVLIASRERAGERRAIACLPRLLILLGPDPRRGGMTSELDQPGLFLFLECIGCIRECTSPRPRHPAEVPRRGAVHRALAGPRSSRSSPGAAIKQCTIFS